MFAITNSADDLSPWAIIIAREACIPHLVFEFIPATTNPMCPTEEYAISDFKSVCRIQINPVTSAPVRATLTITEERCFNIYLNRCVIRNSPYPPSLSRIAARIMDPAIGASTWALGSHKCVVNIGNLTRNPPSVMSHAIAIDG